MTYYNDKNFFNGLPVSSLFCYTALLCLHQCLLHIPCAFYSFVFYALCAMSLQCTIPLLYISTCCALPPSSHLNHTQQPHPFFLCSTFLYSLYTLCMQSSSCSYILSHPNLLHIGLFLPLLLFHNYPISCVPHGLSLFCISCSL
jgi:hypothetical protein